MVQALWGTKNPTPMAISDLVEPLTVLYHKMRPNATFLQNSLLTDWQNSRSALWYPYGNFHSIRNNFANNDQSLFARAGFFAIIYLLQSFQNSNFQKSLQTGKRSIQSSKKLPQLSLEIRFRTPKREAKKNKKKSDHLFRHSRNGSLFLCLLVSSDCTQQMSCASIVRTVLRLSITLAAVQAYFLYRAWRCGRLF